jgi:aspartyl protease family protein
MNKLFWIVIALIVGGLILLVINDSSGETFGIHNDAFARSLYFGILVLVLGAGFIGSHRSFGEMSRQIAMWLLIALGLVAAYQYRYELQDFASRVTAGLIPGSPIEIASQDGRAAVMIDKSANGHFQVRATVNGVTVPFLVDTGASAIVLTHADAERIGIDTSRLDYLIRVYTANGSAMAARAVADRMIIGGIERDRMPVLVAQAGKLDTSLLGMSFLDTLSGFEVRGDRLVLRD